MHTQHADYSPAIIHWLAFMLNAHGYFSIRFAIFLVADVKISLDFIFYRNINFVSIFVLSEFKSSVIDQYQI